MRPAAFLLHPYQSCPELLAGLRTQTAAHVTGPQRELTRAFWASLSVSDAATSKLTSMREAVTFACWPPGPDDRLARTTTSRMGIATERVMGMGSSTGLYAVSSCSERYRHQSSMPTQP